MEIKLALNPKTVELYEDRSGRTHNTKLSCLVANRNIAVRGIIQSDEKLGPKVNNYTAIDVANIIERNFDAFNDTLKAFDRAIKNELKKGSQAEVKG